MTHGTIIQSADGDGRTFFVIIIIIIIIIQEVLLFNTLKRQNSNSLQLTTKDASLVSRIC